MIKAKFFIILFLLGKVMFAQNQTLESRLLEIESSKASQLSIKELNNLLLNPNHTDDLKIKIQTTLVHQYQALQLWDECLNYCQDQVKIAHQLKNSFAEATFYKLIGGTYYYIPKKANALAYWKKCIALAEPNNYHTLLGQCYHNIGVISLENNENLEVAENYFMKAIELSKKNNDTLSPTFTLHYRLLATTYVSENKLDKAENFYKLIIAKCRSLKDSSNLAEGLIFYSDLLVKKKEFQNAVNLSKEALGISKKISLVDAEITALNTHARNLNSLGDFEEAFRFQSEENGLLRKRFDGNLNIKISEAEAKFKNAEVTYEKELAILTAKRKTQNYLFGFLGLLFASVAISYFIYQKRNAKQKLILQKAQLQSLLDGEEKERSRIAKDLHDGIVQDLTAIKLQLNANNKDLSSSVLLNAIDSIDKASVEVRNIAYQMMPTTLIQLGFIPAIEDLLKRVLTPNGIDYEFENIGIVERLPKAIEINIFRISQELLNNVIKHSKASFVSLLISLKSNKLTLIFEDNGIGFNETNITKGIGLNSLYSRVELLNGEIKFENNDTSGVTIYVIIPL